MERYYCFAGVEIALRIPDAFVSAGEGRLAPFAVSSVTQPFVFEFEPVDRFSPPSGVCVAHRPDLQVWARDDGCLLCHGAADRSYLRTLRRGTHHLVQWLPSAHPGLLGSRSILEALNAAHLVNQAGGCILHCSCIEHQGRAILFTAPSGVGKSTQAELWRLHRGAEIVNGDRAAIRMDRGVPVAAGIPFAGSSEYCLNRTLPLAALVCLGQSPTVSLQPLRGIQAFRRVWEGCTVNIWDAEDVSLATQAVSDIIRRVPVLQLDCPPDETAVTALELYLKGQVTP